MLWVAHDNSNGAALLHVAHFGNERASSPLHQCDPVWAWWFDHTASSWILTWLNYKADFAIGGDARAKCCASVFESLVWYLYTMVSMRTASSAIMVWFTVTCVDAWTKESKYENNMNHRGWDLILCGSWCNWRKKKGRGKKERKKETKTSSFYSNQIMICNLLSTASGGCRSNDGGNEAN